MEDFLFQFEKLNAWQEARKLVVEVYRLMKKFPKTENFALCDQLRRAAISVPSNIAEGMTRYSVKDKTHFLEIAFGSLMEVMSQLEVAFDEGYISDKDFRNLENLIAETARVISGLQRSFNGDDNKLTTLN